MRSDGPKDEAARRELREYLDNAPGVALVIAVQDYRKVRRLHNELLSFFRVRFSPDTAKWPEWARGAALPVTKVLIGARKRVERELVRERARRNGEKAK